jgi:hypothetical protein
MAANNKPHATVVRAYKTSFLMRNYIPIVHPRQADIGAMRAVKSLVTGGKA